jgi:hypothetical protein
MMDITNIKRGYIGALVLLMAAGAKAQISDSKTDT